MRQILISGVALVATALLSLAPTQAQWSMSQRGKFLADCIPACEANPNVHASKKPQCGVFCNCVANEGEKMFTSADFEEMDEAARAGRDHPKIQQFNNLVPACNQQAFQ
ncbi:MAG: hypothetical protein FJX20_20135 [Alphaproteobacteria bacterium]|nr:hypothetical protein [Alphaproteobacteria bacterium]